MIVAMFYFLNAWWVYSFVIILEPYSYASCASVYHHSQYKVSKWQARVSVGIHHNCTADPEMRHRIILGIKLIPKILFSKGLLRSSSFLRNPSRSLCSVFSCCGLLIIVFLLTICLVVLSIIKSGLLKSPSITVELIFLPLILSNFASYISGALL